MYIKYQDVTVEMTSTLITRYLSRLLFYIYVDTCSLVNYCMLYVVCS